jgi:hypothetical protein
VLVRTGRRGINIMKNKPQTFAGIGRLGTQAVSCQGLSTTIGIRSLNSPGFLAMDSDRTSGKQGESDLESYDVKAAGSGAVRLHVRSERSVPISP